MLFVLPLPAEVLNQVVVPRPVRRRGRHQPPHSVQLVVAREDQRLPRHGARALVVLDLLVTALDEHV